MPVSLTFLALSAAAINGETRGVLSAGWTHVGPAEEHTFHLSLVPRQPDALAEAVTSVSDPRNASGGFRRYLTEDDLARLLKPVGLEPVEAWLHEAGATTQRQAHGSGQVLKVQASSAATEQLFGAPLARYRSGALVVSRALGVPRSLPPALPTHVSAFVEAVHGLFELPHRPGTRPRANLKGVSCDFKGELIDPNILKSQYGYPEPSEPRGGVSQGVAAFEDAEFSPDDVVAFEAYCELPRPCPLAPPQTCRRVPASPPVANDRRRADFGGHHAARCMQLMHRSAHQQYVGKPDPNLDPEPIPVHRSPSQRDPASEGAQPWRILRRGEPRHSVHCGHGCRYTVVVSFAD